MNKRLLMTVLPLLLRTKSKTAWVVIATLAVLFLVVSPLLKKQVDESRQIVAAEDVGSPTATSRDVTKPKPNDNGFLLKPATPSKDTSSNKPTRSQTSQPTPRPSTNKASSNPTPADRTPAAKTPVTESAQAPLGKLNKIGPKLFETTAGLRYGPGSVDGHRLLHVMQHAEDRPDKPVHGVFEGDEFEIRAAIDEAYLIADLRGPPQAKKSTERDRTIWKVDMKRRVGYLGGQAGKRKGHPPLTGIQLVLEGTSVITAYPIDPRR